MNNRIALAAVALFLLMAVSVHSLEINATQPTKIATIECYGSIVLAVSTPGVLELNRSEYNVPGCSYLAKGFWNCKCVPGRTDIYLHKIYNFKTIYYVAMQYQLQPGNNTDYTRIERLTVNVLGKVPPKPPAIDLSGMKSWIKVIGIISIACIIILIIFGIQYFRRQFKGDDETEKIKSNDYMENV